VIASMLAVLAGLLSDFGHNLDFLAAILEKHAQKQLN
jgi:hypothetical protein